MIRLAFCLLALCLTSPLTAQSTFRLGGGTKYENANIAETVASACSKPTQQFAVAIVGVPRQFRFSITVGDSTYKMRWAVKYPFNGTIDAATGLYTARVAGTSNVVVGATVVNGGDFRIVDCVRNVKRPQV